jgi:hypothetical protein
MSIEIKKVGMTLDINVNGNNSYTLPHGSGIDYDWYWSENDSIIEFTNHYHTMDEQGYYCCVIPFKVKMEVIKDCLTVKSIEVKAYNCDLCYTDDLENYLWDTFSMDFQV